MTFDCMTPDELALWMTRTGTTITAKNPCVDCPAWFAAEARAQGCCNRPTTPEMRERMRLYHLKRRGTL